MNKDAIFRTAILKKDCNDRFSVSSSLCEGVIGLGGTPDEAMAAFSLLVQDRYVAYLENRLAGSDRRGRPAKNYVEFHTQIKPEIKGQLADMAKSLKISQGELIEYLYRHYETKKDQEDMLVIN